MHKVELCPKFEAAFELLGKKWTGLILRTLLGGVSRFSEIEENIPGISARMLTERLKDLEVKGLIERQVYADTPVRIEYTVTEKGRDLEPALDAIQTWASKWNFGQV